jgi:hypothetical protein
LNSIQIHVEKELAARFPHGGPEEEVLKTIKLVFMHGFLHLFTKCVQKIEETKFVMLYEQNLNDYKSTLDDPANLDERLNKAMENLIAITAKYSKTGLFVMHFDEIQKWAVEEWFKRDGDRQVLPMDFRKYYLLGLSDAMLTFKGTNMRFVISGTNIEQGKALRISSQVKTKTLYLPLFSEEAILTLLKKLYNVDHLDEQELKLNIAAPLAGCARSSEYFFSEVQIAFQKLPPKEVSVDALVPVNNASFALIP